MGRKRKEIRSGCDLAEIVRLRDWLEGIHDLAERCMPHATGQGHMALMSIKSAATKALNGEDEAKYKFKNTTGDV